MMRTDKPLRPVRRTTESYLPEMHVLLKELEERDPHTARLTLALPPDLHRRFKAKAALNGKTMSQLLRGFIRAYVCD
ncbi:hypothetical protein [Rhodocaloribacter sp.]|jgi:predicted HicB family RNase H-like nuclease